MTSGAGSEVHVELSCCPKTAGDKTGEDDKQPVQGVTSASDTLVNGDGGSHSQKSREVVTKAGGGAAITCWSLIPFVSPSRRDPP
jgi:hypothetical protein